MVTEKMCGLLSGCHPPNSFLENDFARAGKNRKASTTVAGVDGLCFKPEM